MAQADGERLLVTKGALANLLDVGTRVEEGGEERELSADRRASLPSRLRTVARERGFFAILAITLLYLAASEAAKHWFYRPRRKSRT